MRVREISQEELRKLFTKLKDDRDLLEFRAGISGKELALALLAMYAANRAALGRNYGGDCRHREIWQLSGVSPKFHIVFPKMLN